jgi:N-acetylmuramoyl-L-alanine amidase
MTRILTLDAGHGGKDSGATGNGLQEKDVVLDVVLEARQYLEKHYDCRVYLTRSTDEFVELRDRTNAANEIKSECLVSVHINAASAETANGFESFVYKTDGPDSKSVALQNILHSKLAPLWTAKGQRDRGKKKANYHMVREFKGAAVLVELGFISNKQDSTLLKSSAFRDKNAHAIAEGIAFYLKLQPKQKVDPIYSVLVDGKNVGAYAVPENVTRQVAKAIAGGSDRIEINLLK